MVQSIKNLIAAILIAVSAFLLWTEVLPKYELTSDLKVIINDKKELLNLRTDIVRNVNKLNEEYDKRYSELQRLALVIPEKKSVPEIISTMEAIFNKTNNTIVEFLIGTSANKDGILNKIAITLSASGGYDSFISLLDAFESNIRLFDMNSVTVTVDTDIGEEQTLNFIIKGDVYWINQEADKPKVVPSANNSREL